MVKEFTSYGGTQAVSRAIALLKLFDDDNPELDLQTLANVSGLNKSTTFRILSALESEGLVQKTVQGYRLGAGMIVLGGRAMRSNSLRKVSREFLEQLSLATGESVTLEVLHLNDDKTGATKTLCSLVIDEVVGRHLVGISQYIGSRLPVHATSTGKVLLAYQKDNDLEIFWAQDRKPLTKHTLDTVKLKKQLVQIKKQGYALAKGELEQGLMTAAAPVFGANGVLLAALSIVAPSIRIDEQGLEVLAQEAVKTAQLISKASGFEG